MSIFRLWRGYNKSLLLEESGDFRFHSCGGFSITLTSGTFTLKDDRVTFYFKNVSGKRARHIGEIPQEYKFRIDGDSLHLQLLTEETDGVTLPKVITHLNF